MRKFLTATCLSLLCFKAPAFAGPQDDIVILVLDNSGAVQDSTSSERTRPTFLKARRAMIEHLSDELGPKDHLTILSVTRPKVVWEGPGNRITHRDNFVLANYLETHVNGCADFEKVAGVIKRQLRSLPAPPTKIVMLSSLVHTGSPTASGEPCPYDPENYSPPSEFKDALRDIALNHHTELSFYWVDEGVIEDVDEYFYEAGLAVEIKGELQTIGALQ